MNRRVPLVGIVLAALAAGQVYGHGTPIHVEVADNRLVVDEGISGGSGFASMMYVEDDEEGDFWIETSSSPFLIVWDVPGFDISGMDDNSNLSLDVVRRPVSGTSPIEERNLWYWNDVTEVVEPAPDDFDFHLISRTDERTLTPADAAAPLPLLIADPMTGLQDPDEHGLLFYALDNESSPPSGAYGFFARLTSTWYQPSDPFLVVINNNVDYEKMLPAALAINAAATNAAPKPGDYDGNGQLEPADYQFWRERYGNSVAPFTSPDGNGNGMVDAADYIVWRDAFVQPVAGAFASLAVPEASGFVLTVAALVCLPVLRRNRGLSHHPTISH